jgi:hypothetical protein
MTIGPEEWELISLLKAPKTVVQICRESMLGDFRSCQILWALRLLGAIGEAPLDISIDSALGIMDAHAAPEPAPALAEAPEPASIPLSKRIRRPRSSWSRGVSRPCALKPMQASPLRRRTQRPRGRRREPSPSESDAEETPIPVSAAPDAPVEVISEPWQIASEAPIEDVPARLPSPSELDSSADATVAIPGKTSTPRCAAPPMRCRDSSSASRERASRT